MRLINATTLKLETFDGEVPPYAILSHTWGADEVSFQDIQSPDAATKLGYEKIKFTCEEALERGLDYAWVDTCCIDKSSSAELSEAINSMFTWYKNARDCYAYLSDVSDWTDMRSEHSQFRCSRWWTRGWTLQELLAPSALYFFSSAWKFIGFGAILAKELSLASGIGEEYLTGMSALGQASISRRMSWASKRVTTRIEDQAYSLLGIFGINMPLLYGEGEKAFLRLQEEIIKTSDDQTIFAWGLPPQISTTLEDRQCVFAKNPASFRHSANLVPDEISEVQEHYFLTNKGLKITLPIVRDYPGNGMLVAVLACRLIKDLLRIVAIPIMNSNTFSVRASNYLVHIDRDHINEHNSKMQGLTLLNSLSLITHDTQSRATHPFLIRKLPYGMEIQNVNTHGEWHPVHRVLSRSDNLSISISSKFVPLTATIKIHLKGTTRREQDQLLIYPHALFRVFDDRRSSGLLQFSKDDPAAIMVTCSAHPTRILTGKSTGLEVAVVDIQFVTQTEEARDLRSRLGDVI